MEIRTDPKILHEELQFAEGIVERRTTIPVLSNSLFRAKGEYLEIISTDLDVSLRSFCNAEILSEGVIAIKCKTVRDVVSALQGSGEGLHIKSVESDSERVEIESKTASFKISCSPADEFPHLPEYDFKDSIQLPLPVIKDLFKRAIISSSTEDARYAIRGCLLILEKGGITVVSTDSKRLTQAKENVKIDVDEEVRVIIPRKGILELSRLAKEGDEIVSVGFKENHIFFKINQRILACRKMDAVFPSYDKVIPKDSDKEVVISRDALKKAMGIVNSIAGPDEQGVLFTFSAEGLILMQKCQQSGDEAKEVCPVISYSGEAIQIGFTVSFVEEFLSCINEGNVKINMAGPEKPTIWAPSPLKEGKEHIYVVMPLRLE